MNLWFGGVWLWNIVHDRTSGSSFEPQVCGGGPLNEHNDTIIVDRYGLDEPVLWGCLAVGVVEH